MPRALRVLFAAVLLCALAPPLVLADAQTSPLSGPWYWRNPLPAGDPLWEIVFDDVDHGWAVGDHGVIVRTTDGGASWSLQDSGVLVTLRDVWFADGVNGWAVGDFGTILRTTNGGASWVRQISGTTENLMGVSFADAPNGWAVGGGGTVLHTTNGGTTWTPQTSGVSVYLLSVYAVSPTTACAVGTAGNIRHTTDGGANWTPQTSGTAGYLECVWFTDSAHGWAVGESGTILVTSNGGTTWTPQTSNTTSPLISVQFVDALNGWTCGLSAIRTTDDGGLTWDTVTSPVMGGIWAALSFPDASHGRITSYSDGDIYYTDNRGTTWQRESEGPLTSFSDVNFPDGTHGWAVGSSGTILASTDGGRTWTAQTSGTSTGLYGVSFADATEGWAVGGSGTIRHTANGGGTWGAQTSGVASNLYDVDFADELHGWAVGADGTVIHTSNGGTTWTPQTNGVPPGEDFNRVDFYDTLTGCAVGDDGALMWTDDGGSTWVPYVWDSPDFHDWHGVTLLSELEGWAVGHYGNANTRILHTTDGGDTWLMHTEFGTFNDMWTDISMSPGGVGWICGYTGRLISTIDHGETWQRADLPTASQLEAIGAPRAGRAVVVGVGGTIMSREVETERIAGSDRYATALAICSEHFAAADTVVVATGEQFADALAASGLAGATDAPLLLTKRAYLPDAVLDEIERLGADKAYIVGGEAAVSSAVYDALDDAGLTVERLGGTDRYDTSRVIANEVQELMGAEYLGWAFFARGDVFADALACAPFAYTAGIPVVLTKTSTVPGATLLAIDQADIGSGFVLGGTAAVSDSVKAQIDAAIVSAGGFQTERWSGTNRYETAAEIAQRSVPRGWGSWSFVGLATGKNFPDALAGAAGCGAERGVLLLTDPAALSSATYSVLGAARADVLDGEVFGGTAVVSDSVLGAFADRIE